jgi:excisionase family DNA binding protein
VPALEADHPLTAGSAPVGHDSGVDDAWLSGQQAADRWGVTYRTVYRMLQQGKLPAVKPDGRPFRLRRADVDAFIERSRVRPGQLASVVPRVTPRRTAGS